MDFKRMSDSELASVMVNYINRVDHLCNIIARYIDRSDHGPIQAEQIKNEYRQLKDELREDAKYLDLQRNREGSSLYMGFFLPSIQEAAAWGFTVPVNRAINYAMFSAVSDARYKLTKYRSLKGWEELM